MDDVTDCSMEVHVVPYGEDLVSTVPVNGLDERT